VIVAPVERVSFADRVEALGTTRANESVEITTNVTEKIAKIAFDDGQRVKTGDVLVVLDRGEELAALRSAEAALVERQSAFERTEQLAKQNFAAKAKLDEVRAALQQAEAALDAARARLSDRQITAPFDGVTGLRNVSVGKLVEPGDLITTLDDISVMKLDFAVPSTYLATLRPGLRIVARAPAFPGRDFSGEVRSVDSQIDPVTRSVVARAIVPNPDGLLLPGLLMTVTLFKNPREALVVPEEALAPEGRREFVYLVEAGEPPRAVKREITIGARRLGEVEIVDGLSAGDLVVIHGTMTLRDGRPVEIVATETEEQPLGEMIGAGSGS
jgi:membrane fusion protein (multidrug efflux system)